MIGSLVVVGVIVFFAVIALSIWEENHLLQPIPIEEEEDVD